MEGVSSSFKNHKCSGTTSQVTPQGRHQHANAAGCEVGFKMVTEGPATASSSMSLSTRLRHTLDHDIFVSTEIDFIDL